VLCDLARRMARNPYQAERNSAPRTWWRWFPVSAESKFWGAHKQGLDADHQAHTATIGGRGPATDVYGPC